MSVTTTASKKGFAPIGAPRKPTLVCVGRVSPLSSGKISKSGNYIVSNYSVSASRGNGPTVRSTFLFRPEWLTTTFNPVAEYNLTDDEMAALDQVRAGVGPEDPKVYEIAKAKSAAAFVYKKNIRRFPDESQSVGRNPSFLEAIGQNQRGFEELTDRLLSAAEKEGGEVDIDAAIQTINDWIDDRLPEVGYILTQDFERVPAKDGMYTRIYKPWYKLNEFFYPTDNQLQYFRSKASPTFRVAFEDDTPF